MTVRLGFLGLGWIGRHRMAAMLETGVVEAAAIVEPDPACLAEARGLAPDAAVLPDLHALLGAGLDGLVIATPSAMHASQTIAALEAGLAVFCQKPLGRSAAEATAAVKAARRADRLLGVDLSYRHTAAATAVKGLLEERALGPVHAVDLVFHNAYGPGRPWFFDRRQSGGGCVIDLGVHLVDLALWMLDWPDVSHVSGALLAGGQPMRTDQAEDYAVATLTLATGTVVSLACSWNLQAGQEAVIGASFYGAQGGAAIRNVGGSFYDFSADRLIGTRSERLISPPDAWGGRAAADWTRRLAHGDRFDPAAEQFIAVAATLDRIYGVGAA